MEKWFSNIINYETSVGDNTKIRLPISISEKISHMTKNKFSGQDYLGGKIMTFKLGS